MKTFQRYLEAPIRQDLDEKMVFLGGPRQIGKTTLAKMIAGGFGVSSYLNWDDRDDRKAIMDGRWKAGTHLLILDEIHKFPKWKNLVKGVWDTRRKTERILVTGSSRLDVYRRGGDSLMGRYHYFRLHPLTAREMARPGLPKVKADGPPELRFEGSADLAPLMRYGGFPEPLAAQSDRVWRRWRRERFERVFQEDIRDTESIRSLAQVELLAGLIPSRVGSPLSMKALSEDVEASPKTVKTWIDLLARNYCTFIVPPYHRRLERALKKEAKHYLWDWSEVEAEGPRFENMVASHLLKWCHLCEDYLGFRAELYYLRDLEKREVDFLVVWQKKPWMLVECRLSGAGNLTALNYFGQKLGVTKRYLVTLDGKEDWEDRRTGIRAIPAARFLMALA